MYHVTSSVLCFCVKTLWMFFALLPPSHSHGANSWIGSAGKPNLYRHEQAHGGSESHGHHWWNQPKGWHHASGWDGYACTDCILKIYRPVNLYLNIFTTGFFSSACGYSHSGQAVRPYEERCGQSWQSPHDGDGWGMSVYWEIMSKIMRRRTVLLKNTSMRKEKNQVSLLRFIFHINCSIPRTNALSCRVSIFWSLYLFP